MKYSRIIGTALAVFAFAAPAVASPITYTLEGTGSGTFDGTPFMNQLVEFTLTGDTNNITAPQTGVLANAGPATVTVTGFPTDTLLPTISAFVNQMEMPPIVGFARGSGFTDWSISNSVFSSYPLGVITPTSGPSVLSSFASNIPIGSGILDLTSMDTGTFSATGETPATPLPAALPLFATGLGALGLLGWRRKRKARVFLHS
jgi:hypothetical protein